MSTTACSGLGVASVKCTACATPRVHSERPRNKNFVRATSRQVTLPDGLSISRSRNTKLSSEIAGAIAFRFPRTDFDNSCESTF
jgi:hypothetical protein